MTPWTVACQAPLSVGLPREEHWSGSPFPPAEVLPNPGIECLNLHLLLGRQILDYWAAWEPVYHGTCSQIHKVFGIKTESQCHMWTLGYDHESVWAHPWFKKKGTILATDVDNESARIEARDVWESLPFLLNFVAILLLKAVPKKKKKRIGIQFLLPHCPVCACIVSRSVVSNSLRPRRRQPTRLLCPWDSAGKNTGGGCHLLLQFCVCQGQVSVPVPLGLLKANGQGTSLRPLGEQCTTSLSFRLLRHNLRPANTTLQVGCSFRVGRSEGLCAFPLHPGVHPLFRGFSYPQAPGVQKY